MTKTMKRVSVIALAIVMVFGLSATAFAGSLTKKQAVNKALKDAGTSRSGVYALEAEYDDGHYEIEFNKKSNDSEYSYEISKGGRILEKSVEYVYKHNYSKKKIGKLAARKKVAKFSGVKLATIKKGTCYFERDDGEGKYEVKFKKGNYRYEYDVLAPNGKITEYSKEYIGN